MKKVLFGGLFAVVIAGIYWGTQSFRSGDSSVLDYVPAETLYFVGGAETQSLSQWFETYKAMGFDMRAWIERIAELQPEGGQPDQQPTDNAGESDAENLFMGVLVSADTLQQDVETLFELAPLIQVDSAFYEVGLVPVWRTALAIDIDLWSMLDQAQQQAGIDVQTQELTRGGKTAEYRRYPFTDSLELSLIVAQVGNHIVLTLDDMEGAGIDLAESLGLVLPETSVAESGRLEQLMSEHGYLPYSLFYMDLLATMDVISGKSEARQVEWLDEIAGQGLLASIRTPSCQQEWHDILATLPELSGGFTEVHADQAVIKSVLSIDDPELLDLFSRLRGTLSSSLRDERFLLSYGLGLNGSELTPVLTELWERAVQPEYECDALVLMQFSLSNVNPIVLGSVSGFFQSVRGFGMGVSDLDLTDLAANGGVGATNVQENFEGVGVVTSATPSSLLMAGKAFLPQLAGVDIQDGGPPVRLDWSDSLQLSLALRGKDILIGYGDEIEPLMNSLAVNSSDAPNGLFFWSMDVTKYMALILSEAFDPEQLAQAGLNERQLEEQRLIGEIFAETLNTRFEQTDDFTDKGYESVLRLYGQ